MNVDISVPEDGFVPTHEWMKIVELPKADLLLASQVIFIDCPVTYK